MAHDDTRNTEISDVEVDDMDDGSQEPGIDEAVAHDDEADAAGAGDELDLADESAPLGDLDDEALHEIAPEAAVAESLRNALGGMRGEADRIASLETGDEQVQAAERFAEAAGSLDEQIGSSARADDDARS